MVRPVFYIRHTVKNGVPLADILNGDKAQMGEILQDDFGNYIYNLGGRESTGFWKHKEDAIAAVKANLVARKARWKFGGVLSN